MGRYNDPQDLKFNRAEVNIDLKMTLNNIVWYSIKLRLAITNLMFSSMILLSWNRKFKYNFAIHYYDHGNLPISHLVVVKYIGTDDEVKLHYRHLPKLYEFCSHVI